MNEMDSAIVTTAPARKWRVLNELERRVIGVLVEKAKTTPDGYPMSLNAIVTASNQKSNRYPQMQVTDRQVENVLESLRSYGAVTEVQGSGRVPRYRHHMKEWLGVEGSELAVMAELLLRGSQPVGELRGRAARMAAGQLTDVAALRPVLESLVRKELVIELTAAGRGQWVTHGLFSPVELERERRRCSQGSVMDSGEGDTREVTGRLRPQADAHSDDLDTLREEVAQLRAEVRALAADLDALRAERGAAHGGA